MRLTKVLERQTGYLVFIRFNRVSFYMVQSAVFVKLFSVLIHLFNASTFPDFFPVGKCLYKIPDFFLAWEPCFEVRLLVVLYLFKIIFVKLCTFERGGTDRPYSPTGCTGGYHKFLSTLFLVN